MIRGAAGSGAPVGGRAEAGAAPRTVILVHGIWMTGDDLRLLRRRLARGGRRCRIFRYASLRRSPADNARRLRAVAESGSRSGFDLVAHSLGGLVALHLVAAAADLPLGRMALLGVPVRGSQVARRLAASPLLRWTLGRALDHGLLGDLPSWPGALAGRCGVIAGTRSLGLGRLVTLGALEQPNDGTVAVSETRLPIEHERLELPVSHVSMLFSSRVAEAVARFLETGTFLER